MLLYLLLVVLVSALGGLWPALAAAVLGFLLVNWYFVPPLHTLTIRSGEHVLALAVFLTVAAIVSGFVSLAARRAVEGPRARAEAEVLARLAGSAPAAPLLETLRRVLGLEGAAVLHRHEGGWRIEAATGDRVPESPDGREPHARPRPGARPRARRPAAPQRGPARARRLRSGARRLGRARGARGRGRRRPAPSRPPTSCAPRSSRPSPTTFGRRSPRSRPPSRACVQRDVDWPAEAQDEFLATIDEETDRLNALVGNLLDMSRLQTGALEIDAAPVGLDEVLPAALHSLGVPDGSVRLDVPDTLPRRARRPRAARTGARQRDLERCPLLARRRAAARHRRGRRRGRRHPRRSTAGQACPSPSGSGSSSPSSGSATRGRARASGLGLAVAKGFLEAMGGEIEADDTPGGGLTIVARLRAAA